MSDHEHPGQDPGYGQQPAFGQQPNYDYGQQSPFDPTQPPQFPPDQPYDPNQTAQVPQQPPYDPSQTQQLPPPHYEASPPDPDGQPVYPTSGYDQPPPYGAAPQQYPATPPPGGGGGRAGVVIAAILVVLAAVGAGAYFLFAGSDDDTTAGRPAASTSPGQTFPVTPPIVPPVSIPPISNLPSTPIANVCAFIDDPQTVAIAYVGAAEIGQTDVAQACVWQDSVPRSVTESLDTGGATLFTPTGTHGSTYEFTSTTGGVHLAVTVTKEGDGNYYITAVVKT